MLESFNIYAINLCILEGGMVNTEKNTTMPSWLRIYIKYSFP